MLTLQSKYWLNDCSLISKMFESGAVGKVCRTVAHISPASCIDPVCPVFLACLGDHNVADFVDDSGLGLKGRKQVVFLRTKTGMRNFYKQNPSQKYQ